MRCRLRKSFVADTCIRANLVANPFCAITAAGDLAQDQVYSNKGRNRLSKMRPQRLGDVEIDIQVREVVLATGFDCESVPLTTARHMVAARR